VAQLTSPDQSGRLSPSFAGTACTDDESKPFGAAASDTFAECSKDVLESDRGSDLALAGPGIDPDTKQLAAGNYLTATTYWRFDRTRPLERFRSAALWSSHSST
jgi:hypothetical protein